MNLVIKYIFSNTSIKELLSDVFLLGGGIGLDRQFSAWRAIVPKCERKAEEYDTRGNEDITLLFIFQC